MNATAEIRKAYSTWKTQNAGQYMPITEIVNRTDLTMEQITEGVRELYRGDERFTAIPNSIQGDLTEEDRRYAVPLGARMVHLVGW